MFYAFINECRRNEEPENCGNWMISRYDNDDNFDDDDNNDDYCVFYDDTTCVSSARSQYLPVKGNGQSHSSSLKIILESR